MAPFSASSIGGGTPSEPAGGAQGGREAGRQVCGVRGEGATRRSRNARRCRACCRQKTIHATCVWPPPAAAAAAAAALTRLVVVLLGSDAGVGVALLLPHVLCSIQVAQLGHHRGAGKGRWRLHHLLLILLVGVREGQLQRGATGTRAGGGDMEGRGSASERPGSRPAAAAAPPPGVLGQARRAKVPQAHLRQAGRLTWQAGWRSRQAGRTWYAIWKAVMACMSLPAISSSLMDLWKNLA